MYRPIYTANASISFVASGKEGKKKGINIQTEVLPNVHMFTFCGFLLENGRGGTVYSIS